MEKRRGTVLSVVLRALGRTALVLIGLAALYFAAALIAVALPSAEEPIPDAAKTETIHITSNGVHTDIVVAVANARIDWREHLPEDAFATGFGATTHVGFGWGSRQFYLNAPTWGDLTAWTALKAMAFDETYYHVSAYNGLRASDLEATLRLTPGQMARLERFILSRFETGPAGKPVPVQGGYHGIDAFFRSKGTYWPLVTCNQWTSRALREAGQQVSVWAPFAESILWSLADGAETAAGRSP